MSRNTKGMTPSSRAKAFTLTEILATVLLLAVFMLLATYVFTDTFKLMSTYKKYVAESQRMDGITDRLRSDVWNAQSILVAEDQASVILQSMTHGEQAQIIRWSFGQDRQLHRVQTLAVVGGDTKPLSESRWNSLSAIKFIPGKATLLVQLTEPKPTPQEPGKPQQTLAFTSQVLMGRIAE